MLTYEVQYRCYLSELHHDLPFIHYRYRKSGKIFWEHSDRVPIDQFAAEHWKNEYYDGKAVRMTLYNRMRIMRDILDRDYKGNLKNYVKAMVEFEIMSDLIDNEEDYDAQEICLSFVTDGWERTTVRVKNAGA